MSAGNADKLVLLVEDEEALRRGIQIWLRSVEGFALLTASDGNQGLELIERYQPDLVISDVRMPGRDGLDLLLECRARFPYMRFVVLSAYGSPDIETRSLHYGAVRFLHKPVEMTTLERTILEVLAKDSNGRRTGVLRGLSVTGLVQLLGSERKSTALRIRRRDGVGGYILLVQGSLWHAEVFVPTGQGTSGLEAALDLLLWEDVEMWIEPMPQVLPAQSIAQTMQEIVLKAAQKKDEAER